jgi:hypothetical protein
MPGKKTAVAGNSLDHKENKKYHLNNSFRGWFRSCFQERRIRAEVHHLKRSKDIVAEIFAP